MFLSIFTPTYRRPKGLQALMASVQAQTACDQVQHVIVPDYVGKGIVQALFRDLPTYAACFVGDYVTLLADDDVLAAPDVVAKVQRFAEANGRPEVIVVDVVKAGLRLPACDLNPPVMGAIDLGCFLVRRDIWLQHVQDYGDRYEGDFDHAMALWQAQRWTAYCPVLFTVGAASKGAAEAA